MKVFYLQNENQEIIEDGYEQFDERCKSIDSTQYRIVNGYNGALFFVEYTKTEEYKTKAAEFKARSKLNALRHRREEECFAVINRGALWYDRLTESQKAELDEWYEAWLNVTETEIVPEQPIWLN
ncbi:MAG: hypothetical protein K2O89_02260 [Clostridia bacterium]|nr:hypothetical protein [Clostridia bacterium]